MSITDYEASKYNALPNIRSVVKTLSKSGAGALIKGALKDALKSHNVAGKFGIQVLHAPFYLEGEGVAEHPEPPLVGDEKIISFGSVALPLSTAGLSSEALAHVVPSTWGFRGGAITPIQFAYSPDVSQDALSSADLAFFEEVKSIVAKNPGAENFGVTLLAHATPGVTVLQGRNAVTLPAEVGKLAPGDERYDVLWAVKGDEVVTLAAISGGSLAGHFHCLSYYPATPAKHCHGWNLCSGWNDTKY